MKKLRIRDILEGIGCFATAAILVFLFFGGLATHMDDGQTFEMPDGWMIKKGAKTYVNVSTEDMPFVFEGMKEKDTYAMSHPLNVQSHDPLILRIYSRLSAVRVMVDNKQIYSYGFSDVAAGKMVGSGYHFILLPTSYYGKTLTIVFEASVDNAISSAPEIMITGADDAVSIFARGRLFGFFSGLFMFIAGLFLIMLSISAVYIDRRFYPMVAIGLFSCAAGIWCLSTIKALQLFSGDITLNSTLEYMSMYFLPVPALFLSLHFRQAASPGTRKFISFVTVVATLYFLITCFLHIAGITDVTKVVWVYHILLIPILFTLFFVGGSKWRRMKAPERMYQLALVLILLMVILEVCVYYVVNVIYNMSAEINTIVMPFAMMILSVVMAIGFLLEIYDMRLKDTERERLQKLAYRDQMTGLMNRGMWEKRLQELRKNGESFYLLDMDLNRLKQVNDKYGHLMGDRYIQVFSEVIVKAFGGDRGIYRVGGDEFLYVDTEMNGADMEKKVEFIKKLEKIMGREADIPFEVDASFGIAGSDEIAGDDPEEVYRLADQRMYGMKKRLKKQRK